MAIPQLVIVLAAGIGGSAGGMASDRDGDPVVLPGHALVTLGDATIDDVVGFRYEGEWCQIPVQIDERKEVDFATVYHGPDQPPSGLSTLAYADSTTYTGADSDPTFDHDDELVFMARDAGDRAPTSISQPSGVLPGTGVEVEITDSLTRAVTFVYLFRSDGSVAPDAGWDYVDYTFNLLAGDYLTDYSTDQGPNPEDTEAGSPYYRTHFSDRWIRDEVNVFAGDATGVDILDRHTNQFGPGNCVRSEDTFSAHEGAFLTNKDGAVRAIRSYLGASSGPLTQREHLFYDRRQDITTFLRVHAIPGIMDLYDYGPAAAGMDYYNDLNTAGVLVDGLDDIVTVGPISWEMVTGPQGSLVIAHAIDTDVEPFAYTSFYSDNLDPDPAPCTGDAFEYGKSGLWVDMPIPNTDPLFGAYNTVIGRRIVYYEAPGQSVETALLRSEQAHQPPEVTTRPYPPYLGDADGNCCIDGNDYAAFAGCLSEPANRSVHQCTIFDWDADLAVSLTDFAGFQRAFTGSDESLPGCYP